MKPPKLDHMTAVQIQSMGLTLGLCYQPEHMFIKNGRKLSRVAEPGDPWFVTLRRMDRVILAEHSHRLDLCRSHRGGHTARREGVVAPRRASYRPIGGDDPCRLRRTRRSRNTWRV